MLVVGHSLWYRRKPLCIEGVFSKHRTSHCWHEVGEKRLAKGKGGAQVFARRIGRKGRDREWVSVPSGRCFCPWSVSPNFKPQLSNMWLVNLMQPEER